ncbi:MAG: AAA family ATPase [Desulfovibrionaceae bacterium]|nr:AAA family ATPase [Desulfovibrionaceae bacterium]
MPKIESLKTARLHATCDPQRLPWEDSRSIPLPGRDVVRQINFQPRVLKALDLALQIKTIGYNVYVSGHAGLGRTHTVLSYLTPRARKAKVPGDVIYAYNFENSDQPRLFTIPAGAGRKVRDLFRDAVQEISKNLSKRFDDPGYMEKHAKLLDQFQNKRVGLLHKMNDVAHTKGFHLEMDENGGVTLQPMADGKRLSDEEFEKLDSDVRLELKRKGDNLVRTMAGMMRQLALAEEAFQADEKDLNRLALSNVLNKVFDPLVKKIVKLCLSEPLGAYFDTMREDMLKNTEAFILKDGGAQPSDSRTGAQPIEDILSHYAINLFVDNSETEGAPVIVEEHPTAANLLGCVEREAELGALVTNFSLIRAGSLHKANGGFLIIRIEDLLQYANAWEGLLRSLRANEARIEDIDDASDTTIRTKGISPEPLPLDCKVILIGNEELYETLLENDERFFKLFRIKAHMTEFVDRTAANIRKYLVQIAGIIKAEELLPFDRTALAWLVDHGCHLSEDQQKLSLQFPLLRELMIEACALAAMKHADMVSSEILEEAYGERIYRANLVEELFLEEYDRDMIKVSTSGTAVGQVNGLSVTTYGDYEFGLPHRISCIVGVGQEGIIDLEREAELGGPIHTKAMMILKSFLIKHFAGKKPLVLSGSLYFEQNYATIEGDSASGAELVALLSALAEVPVRQDLAFTGAVSHTGEIMPVGGVSRKIEGFFKVCSHHDGLTGTQGVLIPSDNVDHLMLAPNVLEAVENGRFFIYPVQTIEEALFLLTGLSAGKQRTNGSYTEGSLYARVDHRLQLLGEYAQNAFRRTSAAKKKAAK